MPFNKYGVICLLITVFLCSFPRTAESKPTRQPALIPYPAKLELQPGTFVLDSATVVISTPGTESESAFFVESVKPATGYSLTVKPDTESLPLTNYIQFKLDSTLTALGEEGYTLKVQPDKIIITAYRSAGIFYGIQSIRQLLPVEIFHKLLVNNVQWKIPSLSIEDKPRFEWRGYMLDCSRHFFPKETVLRAIDLMAIEKMNRFHWHLVDDQGWRLEIKQYPRLTEFGSWRIKHNGDKEGGYYTQNDVKEIVSYASTRHLIVVPEIEMPGHTSEVLASYPELGCTGGPYRVQNNRGFLKRGIYKDVFCAGNDSTFVFIQNVLDEVFTLFPSPYLHIGADECPKKSWAACPRCQARIKAEGLKNEAQLQSYFVNRVQQFVASRGKRLAGWEEIMEGGLPPETIVQPWRAVLCEKRGIAAAKKGHDVVMSPWFRCYINNYYFSMPVEKAYRYNPIPKGVSPEIAKHFIGIEATLWSEYISTRDDVDFQTYPRMSALSEVGWTPLENKDWVEFKNRLRVHYKRFDILDVNYGFFNNHNPLKDAVVIGTWSPEQMDKHGKTREWDVTGFIHEAGNYSVTPWFTKGTSGVKIQGMTLLEDGIPVGVDSHEGFSGACKRGNQYILQLMEYHPGAKYTLQGIFQSVGGTNSRGEIYFKKNQ